MGWLSAALSLLAAIAAVGAAWYWREDSKVYGKIDSAYLKQWANPPDVVWAFAALDAIKESGELNRKAASWAAASAIISFVAGLATAASLLLKFCSGRNPGYGVIGTHVRGQARPPR